MRGAAALRTDAAELLDDLDTKQAVLDWVQDLEHARSESKNEHQRSKSEGRR